MKIVKARYEIMTDISKKAMYGLLEEAGRTCYKSEDKITDSSNVAFVEMIDGRGHYSVLEHKVITVRFISNRGFSHELVRHRIGSYSQESTRFCNYSAKKFNNEISCIDLSPSIELQARMCNYSEEKEASIQSVMLDAWLNAETAYFEMLNLGCTPEIARNVLPIGLKTEIVATYNLRQWKEVFRQRCARVAHPNMRELMLPLLTEFAVALPEVFGALHNEIGEGLPTEANPLHIKGTPFDCYVDGKNFYCCNQQGEVALHVHMENGLVLPSSNPTAMNTIFVPANFYKFVEQIQLDCEKAKRRMHSFFKDTEFTIKNKKYIVSFSQCSEDMYTACEIYNKVDKTFFVCHFSYMICEWDMEKIRDQFLISPQEHAMDVFDLWHSIEEALITKQSRGFNERASFHSPK